MGCVPDTKAAAWFRQFPPPGGGWPEGPGEEFGQKAEGFGNGADLLPGEVQQSAFSTCRRHRSPYGVWVVSALPVPRLSAEKLLSPYGVWVASLWVDGVALRASLLSPYGVWVVSDCTALFFCPNALLSPYGVWVVSQSALWDLLQRKVIVPFRGMGCVTTQQINGGN